MLKFLKRLWIILVKAVEKLASPYVNAGTRGIKDEETIDRVKLVNTLSLIIAVIMVPIAYIVLRYVIFTPLIFAAFFVEFVVNCSTIYLNYQKKYLWASSVLYYNQCVFVTAFGYMLGTVQLQFAIIFLISIIFLVIREKGLRRIGFIAAICTLVILQIIYFTDVQPLVPITPTGAFIIQSMVIAGVIIIISFISKTYVYSNDKGYDLRRTNRNKKMFIEQITHEMRSPLNAIGLLAKTMLKEIKKQPNLEPLRPYVEMIIVGSNTTRNIVNNVLDMAEIEAGKTETSVDQTFFVRPFFSKLIELSQFIGKSRNIRIHLLINQMPSVITSDPLKLSQVMNNLLSNAIKYGLRNSLVTVTLARSGENKWTIQVKNEGLPIDEKTRATLFEPYITGKTEATEGTGLGLYIVRNRLESMGGQIEIDCIDDQYIIFTATLPLRIGRLKDVKREEEDDEITPGNLSNAKVLIGEDEPSNANALALFLTKIGCRPEIAHNGRELLSKAILHPPDLIMMDYDMPLMNGIVALQQLKANPVLKKVPVIVTTGDIFTDSVDKLLEAGADSYILKPIQDITLLQRVLNKYLSRKNDEFREWPDS